MFVSVSYFPPYLKGISHFFLNSYLKVYRQTQRVQKNWNNFRLSQYEKKEKEKLVIFGIIKFLSVSYFESFHKCSGVSNNNFFASLL